MAEQLAFDLPSVPALGREDFFLSSANTLAMSVIEDWQNWPNRKLVLTGPKSAGKTHLAHVWASLSGATIHSAKTLSTITPDTISSAPLVIEDIQDIAGSRDAETALFHIHNLCQAAGHSILFTADTTIGSVGLILPDLLSRLQGTSTVALDEPDDALLSAVLLKLFADRQLMPAPTVTQYLAANMERSFDAAAQVVEIMDKEALASGRALNRGLARDVLDNFRNLSS